LAAFPIVNGDLDALHVLVDVLGEKPAAGEHDVDVVIVQGACMANPVVDDSSLLRIEQHAVGAIHVWKAAEFQLGLAGRQVVSKRFGMRAERDECQRNGKKAAAYRFHLESPKVPPRPSPS